MKNTLFWKVGVSVLDKRLRRALPRGPEEEVSPLATGREQFLFSEENRLPDYVAVLVL